RFRRGPQSAGKEREAAGAASRLVVGCESRRSRPLADGRQAAAAFFGRRPRRAAGRPGILPAQSSQRSACLAPRRASAYVTRNVAPLPSPTSFSQLSHTSTVFRATEFLLANGVSAAILVRNHAAFREARIRYERSSDRSARSSTSSSISCAPTTRKWRGRKSSIVRASRYCSITAGLTYEARAT